MTPFGSTQAVINQGDCVYVLASTDWAMQNKDYTSNLHVAMTQAKTDAATGGAAGGEQGKLEEVKKKGAMRCPMEHRFRVYGLRFRVWVVSSGAQVEAV